MDVHDYHIVPPISVMSSINPCEWQALPKRAALSTPASMGVVSKQIGMSCNVLNQFPSHMTNITPQYRVVLVVSRDVHRFTIYRKYRIDRKMSVITIVEVKYRLCIVLPYTHLNSAKKKENLAKKGNLMFLTNTNNPFQSGFRCHFALDEYLTVPQKSEGTVHNFSNY